MTVLEVEFHSDSCERGSLFLDSRRLRNLTRVVPKSICVQHRDQPQRRDVEALVEAAFAKSFGSRTVSQYPSLMSVHDGDGDVLAAIGFRAAEDEALYLEQYFTRPIEQVLQQATGRLHLRRDLVEIGSLASKGKGASIFLFVALAAYLRQRRFAYAVATATDTLQNAFSYFGIQTTDLGSADRLRLRDSGASWGTYYSRNPKVVAGEIVPNFSRLEKYLPAEHNTHLGQILSASPETVQ